MNARLRVRSYFQGWKPIDWRLLLFLLIILNVKLLVKLAVILVIYCMQPRFRFGFKFRNSRLPLFYPMIIGIACLDFIIYKQFGSAAQLASFITGICFWVLCILAIHQLKNFTERLSTATIVQTLVVFFLINAFISYAEYIRIVIETGSINPYRYQGDHQKYFISTGDYIKGVSFDTSVTNGVLNALGLIFFLFRRNIPMVFLCMSVLLMTASNLTNILLFFVLLYVFIFNADRDQKSIIASCAFLLIIFLVKISPQNNQYISEIYAKLSGNEKRARTINNPVSLHLRPDSILSPEEKKQKIAILYLDSVNRETNQKEHIVFSSLPITTGSSDRPALPEVNIHSAPFQNRDEINPARERLLDFMQAENISALKPGKLPGKFIAAGQIIALFRSAPSTIFTGKGIGSFSSKLAFRTTALGIAGGYPERLRYIDPLFASNHLLVYLSFFSGPAKMHSVINSPNSVYLQIAGEYGVAGILALIIGYLGYFMKRVSFKGYGVPVLLLLTGVLLTDYWFEQLSVLLLFELVLLLNQKENPRA